MDAFTNLGQIFLKGRKERTKGNADGQKSRDKTRETRPVTQLRWNKRGVCLSSSRKCLLPVSLNSISFYLRVHVPAAYTAVYICLSQIMINSSCLIFCASSCILKKKRRAEKKREKIPRFCLVHFSRSHIRSSEELKSMRKDTRGFPLLFLIPFSISISFTLFLSLSFATEGFLEILSSD